MDLSHLFIILHLAFGILTLSPDIRVVIVAVAVSLRICDGCDAYG